MLTSRSLLFFPLTFIPARPLRATTPHQQSGCFWSSHRMYFKMLRRFLLFFIFYKDIHIWVGVSVSHLNTARWINAVIQCVLYVYTTPGPNSVYYCCLLSILGSLGDRKVSGLYALTVAWNLLLSLLLFNFLFSTCFLFLASSFHTHDIYSQLISFYF